MFEVIQVYLIFSLNFYVTPHKKREHKLHYFRCSGTEINVNVFVLKIVNHIYFFNTTRKAFYWLWS